MPDKTKQKTSPLADDNGRRYTNLPGVRVPKFLLHDKASGKVVYFLLAKIDN